MIIWFVPKTIWSSFSGIHRRFVVVADSGGQIDTLLHAWNRKTSQIKGPRSFLEGDLRLLLWESFYAGASKYEQFCSLSFGNLPIFASLRVKLPVTTPFDDLLDLDSFSGHGIFEHTSASFYPHHQVLGWRIFLLILTSSWGPRLSKEMCCPLPWWDLNK